MEPVDSATIVKIAYSPSLETGGEGFEKIRAEKLARLRQIVKNKLKGNPKAEQALTMLEQETGAELATIKTYLDTELERDPDFAEELKRLGAEIIENEWELTYPRQENIWERGNKLIPFMAGGAFIGGIIAQAPGAIIGAILSAIYASFVQTETGEHDSH